MRNQQSFEDLQSHLEGYSFTLTQPNFRYLVQYTEDEAYAFLFDNLAEVQVWLEGFDTAMEFMQP
jgi:hypothetical protein